MIKTHKYSRIVEMTSTRLWGLIDSKDAIVYQVEYVRFSETDDQSFFLVELEWK